MELTRQKLDDRRTPAGLRARQLQARDMLRVDLEGEELERYLEERVFTTTLDKSVAWAQGNSIYPLTFGLACCAIEMMTIVAARMDVARFGFEFLRASPRQADLIILSGRVSIKMAPVIRRLYDQMLEPKWAIAMGACCSSTGVFNNYALVAADKFMPIDVHVQGCPRVRKHSCTGSFSSATRFTATNATAGASATTRWGQRKCAPSNRQQSHQPDRQSPGDQFAIRTPPPGEFPPKPTDERRGL